jgi:hypothetical protein
MERRKLNMRPMVKAIRIYFNENTHGATPLADLKMTDGVVETIGWADSKQRKKFMPYITGYTLIYDERPKADWDKQ